MKPRLLPLACVALTLLFASTPHKGRAQTAPSDKMASAAKTPSPFDDVSAYAWPYVAVDTLQKAGIVIGYPDGTYGGRPTMTRYEFAVSIARMLPLLAPAKAPPAGNSDMNALHGQMQVKFEQNPLAPNAMLALMDEFQTELVRLGQANPANGNPLGAARQQLKLWKSHQGMDGRSFALTPVQARSPFADVPADDSIYRQVDALQKAGVLIVSPNSPVKGPRILTRLQLATEIAPLVPLRGPLPGMPTESGLQALPPPPANLTALLIRSPHAVTALTALLQEFTPELGWLDRDASAARTRLAALRTRPFRDATEKLWASPSVETLRLNGILVGYPDGAFETSDGHD